MRTVVSVVLLVLAGWTPAHAQNFRGSIRGTARDEGGVVPEAAIELVEESTGLARTTVTNEQGEYSFTGVLPGGYAIKATVGGYKTYERGGLQIGTQSSLTIDIALEVGNVAETVTVSAESPRVERSNASVTALLDRNALETLPSAGRNVFIMAGTTPTVLPTGNSQFVRQQDQSNSSLISIGGGPRRDHSYVLDGVPIVDVVNRATFIPSFQAIEELRVQVSAYDAEIGRTSGGVFNATARSGSNVWRGNAMYQDRPGWAQGKLFFAEKNNIESPDSYYHLYGGGVGGPIVRNRTFFYASTEGYRSSTAYATVLRLPTAAERRGDFSQSGVTLYDPLTTRVNPANPTQFIRDPFPNNQIPANRLNPVAVAALAYLPLPTSGKSLPATAAVVDQADQITGKVTHRWSDAVTSNVLYAWYRSLEPSPRFYGKPLFENGADPGDGALVRRVNMIALNNTWTPGSHTVVEARYGFTRFLDDNRPAAFDPSQLGFDPRFLAAVPLAKFPGLGISDYASLGDRPQETATYYSHALVGSLSSLVGRHTLKAGGDYRITGVRFLNVGGTGSFGFSRDFTFGPNPNAPGSSTGDAFASFLLGYPSSGGISISSPIDAYLGYWSGFVQDDFRVTPALTLNAGLRYEFEQGLEERDNRMIVGWGSGTAFPLQVGGTRPDGTPLALTGGFVYAGVGGAPTHQGHPSRTQFAPRASFAYALDERTSVRGGYGLFWAPAQGISASESGSSTHGYNQTTDYVATTGNPFIPCATCSLTNPFPAGIRQPQGNSLGALTGVGGTVDFVDPQATMGHFHRYSLDLQHELPGQIVVSVGYLRARGEDLGLGGTVGFARNINQLDPKYLALGTALQAEVPNPFVGTALAVGILSGATVPRGQLLRPYPQFDNVYTIRSPLAHSRYHAVTLSGDRRLSSHWALRADYTWSRLTDNQTSESNFFAGGSNILDNYDVERDFGLSVVDAPHRLNVAGLVELPFGLTISAVASYQSGFPLTINQSPANSNLLGSTQRPNIVVGVNPQLTDDAEASYDPVCSCIPWLNPTAWTQTAPFTFGNQPRTDGRVRTPPRRNVDVAIQKSHRVGPTIVVVKAELINALNAADFLGPNSSFGSSTFGQIQGVGGFPRMVQISVRAGW